MVRIFKNIGIGDLLMAIRRCSSLLRCCRCSMSDVYIGQTLVTRPMFCLLNAQFEKFTLVYGGSLMTVSRLSGMD